MTQSGNCCVMACRQPCFQLLVFIILVAFTADSVHCYRRISFGSLQTRCSARGEYCSTNEQCCEAAAGVECVTLKGIGQCLSARDRAIVFEYACESTDNCMEGYCCVASAGYRSKSRRCKAKQSDETVCHEEHMDQLYYHGYMRVGKGKNMNYYEPKRRSRLARS